MFTEDMLLHLLCFYGRLGVLFISVSIYLHRIMYFPYHSNYLFMEDMMIWWCLFYPVIMFLENTLLHLLCFYGRLGVLFNFSNRVFTEGTCKLLTLVISDLVDEDCVLHRRKQAVSALMFGTVALLSKPGQTLAPLIGTWLLAHQTGQILV